MGLHGAAHLIEAASAPVTVPGHGATVLRADALLDGFRDLTFAYRFGPRALEVVTVALRGPDGGVLAEAAYLPGGPARPRDPALGLQAGLERADGGAWLLSVSTDRFAQRVQVRFPGFRASDSWFHLAPGQVRQVLLRPGTAARGRPTGSVSALNATGQLTVGR